MRKEFEDEKVAAMLRYKQGRAPNFNLEILDRAKIDLVQSICDMFQNPAEWPLTDSQRIEKLKQLYRDAYQIHGAEVLVNEVARPVSPPSPVDLGGGGRFG